MSAKFAREQAKAALVRAVQDGIGLGGSYLQLEMKKMLSNRGTGRIYIKPSGRQHQASAPDHPPALDTGHYTRSIQVDVSQQRAAISVVRVGSNVIYGRSLEFGSPSGQVAARPHWIPMLRAKQNKVREIVLKLLEKRIAGIKLV